MAPVDRTVELARKLAERADQRLAGKGSILQPGIGLLTFIAGLSLIGMLGTVFAVYGIAVIVITYPLFTLPPFGLVAFVVWYRRFRPAAIESYLAVALKQAEDEGR